MEVSFLIPYKSDNGPRDQIFNWTSEYYKNAFPDSELCIGNCYSSTFSRSQAINDAASKSTKDYFVIMDSDLIVSPETIKKSIEALESHAWVIPYSYIKDLHPETTHNLMNNPPQPPLSLPTTFMKSKKMALGGINVMHRRTFNEVKGFDERFIGWGGEDDAFSAALNTLAGKFHRLDEDIYHLWHPNAKAHGNPHYYENASLANRYKQAEGNKEAMLNILKER